MSINNKDILELSENSKNSSNHSKKKHGKYEIKIDKSLLGENNNINNNEKTSQRKKSQEKGYKNFKVLNEVNLQNTEESLLDNSDNGNTLRIKKKLKNERPNSNVSSNENLEMLTNKIQKKITKPNKKSKKKLSIENENDKNNDNSDNKDDKIKRKTNREVTIKQLDKCPKNEETGNNTKFDEEKNNSESSQQDDEPELNFRQRLTRFLEYHDRLYYMRIVICCLSFATYLYYFICTYVNSLFQSLNYIDYLVCTIFIFEHIINILIAHHSLIYTFSIESLINFITELPPFFSVFCEDYYLNLLYRFINISRVLRLLRTYRIIEIIQAGEKNVNSQIFNIIALLFMIIFIWGGTIQMLDLGDVEKNSELQFAPVKRNNLMLRKNYHHYLYFITVSLTTVGYGEIMPYSLLGKVMIIALVIVILVAIPDQTSELINLSNSQTIYERKKYISSPDIPFVVLMGEIELESLKSFCKEYFYKDHGDYYRHIVILCNHMPSKFMETYLNESYNSKFIHYLQGDPMNKNDLLRTDILNSKSCIIFTNKNTRDPYSEDHQSLLLAIFVKKFFYRTTIEKYQEENKNLDIENVNYSKILKNNSFRICLQLNRPESSAYYYSTLQSAYRNHMLGDQLLILESLKMNLLSKSCLTPGIMALIANLMISSINDRTINKGEPEWKKEYSEGQQYEICKYTIEGDLINYSFQKIVLDIYHKFHGIVIALEIGYKGGVYLKLNPLNNETLKDIMESIALSQKSGNANSTDHDDAFEKSGNNETDDKKSESVLGMELSKKSSKKVLLKKIDAKVSLFIICSGKSVIEEIYKYDLNKVNMDGIEGNKSIMSIYSGFNKDNENENENKPLKTNTRKKSNLKENKSSQYGILDSYIKNSVSKLKVSSLKKEKSKNIKYSTNDNKIKDENETSTDESEEDDSKKNNIVDMNDSENTFLNDYYTLEGAEKNYLYTNEIMRQGIKDRSDIQNHVLICGMHPEIIHFILPLRAKYLPVEMLKWIVILAPILPQEIHDTLSKFPKVIFIQGDPLHPENLFRANITTADIAIILSASFNNYYKVKESNYFSDFFDKENDEIQLATSNGTRSDEIDEDIMDSTTIFIYKSIKKINKSIQIITELYSTKNIEYLLSSRNLKKLYTSSVNTDESLKKLNTGENDDYNQKNENNPVSLRYDLTPIYAAGEIYLPSFFDKITGQIFYNPSLLSVLRLFLNGEKKTINKQDIKLEKLLNIEGSNLFLIKSEPRNESFSDMFKRLLTKYGMIAIGLYRKNPSENFYYVYTNPKKTTLMRETDFIFVLTSSENLVTLLSKNLQGNETGRDGENQKRTDFNNDGNTNNNPSLFKILQDSIQQQIRTNLMNTKNDEKNINNINNTPIKIIDPQNKKDSAYELIKMINEPENKENKENKEGEEKKEMQIQSSILFKKNESDLNENSINQVKYKEIDQLQKRVNKSIQRLKEIQGKCQSLYSDVDNFVKEEITNELLVYINKSGGKK